MRWRSWGKSWLWFLSPFFCIWITRAFIAEPFTIPSGSMIPQLLVHDYIVVNKLAFGIRNPFQKKFLLQYSEPQRGQIVVFYFPENPDVFYIKRLIGLPGDQIEIVNGEVFVNDVVYTDLDSIVKTESPQAINYPKTVVPDSSFFMLGDNRNHSLDSRYWGFVPRDFMVGVPWKIWMSCDRTNPDLPIICDFSTMRWNRVFKTVL